MDGEKNCFYDYEKPNYYIDSSTFTLKPCLNNCYQCNESQCLSCIRGYQLNQETFQCEQCSSNEYIYVLDEIEFCEASERNIYYCELKYTECSGINIYLDNFECPREFPLLKEDSNECVLEYVPNINYLKSNQIIKTQWMNKINQIGIYTCLYILFSLNSKGDLILLTYQYEGYISHSERYFYGIKKNGRPFFYNKINNQFEYEKILNSTSTVLKYESEFLRINIYGNDEKDYYFSCSFADFVIEIADLENGTSIGIPQGLFFGYYYWVSKYYSVFELKNEKYIYMFCYSITEESNTNFYLIFKKFKFFNYDLNIEGSFEEILSSTVKDEYKIAPSQIVN